MKRVKKAKKEKDVRKKQKTFDFYFINNYGKSRRNLYKKKRLSNPNNFDRYLLGVNFSNNN